MKFLEKVGNLASEGVFQVKKNSPIILTVSGVALVATSVYTTYKAAPKVEQVLDAYDANKKLLEEWNKEENVAKREEQKYEGPEPTEITKKDLVIDLAKKLWVPVVTGVAGVGCFIWSYKIQQSRITALAGAVSLLAAEQTAVRERYKEKYGDEEATKFFDTDEKEITEVDSKGKEKKKVVTEVNVDTLLNGVWFNKSGEWASDDPEYNEEYVKHAIQEIENKLFSRGRITVNDALEILGIQTENKGALLGWYSGDASFSHTIVQCYNEELKYSVPEIRINWSTPCYIYE